MNQTPETDPAPAAISSAGTPPEGESALARRMRRADPDRFLCIMMAPADRREDLLHLLEFYYETGKIRESVSETMLGHIRLQWWREGLDRLAGTGETGASAMPGHETLTSLAALHERQPLALDSLQGMLDARELEFEEDSPDSLAAFLDYLDGTAGALTWMMVRSLASGEALPSGGEAQARKIGMAYGLVGLLRALPFQARHKRCLLPRELCARHGLNLSQMYEKGGSPELAAVTGELLAEAERLLQEARQEGAPGSAVRAPLLQARLAKGYAARLKKAAFDPFALLIPAKAPWRPLTVGWGALTGRL